MIDFLAHYAGLIGLLFFFTFFTLTAFWVFRPGSKQDYDAKSFIPLNEDGPHE